MTRRRRAAGLVGIALRQLLSDRFRTAFAVVGVAFAVLSVTLLTGVATGVVETGETLLDESEQDLWVSGGPISIQPGSVGGFQNPMVDAHATADAIAAHDDVRVAAPMAFQAVYVSPDGEEFDTLIGSGVPAGVGLLTLEAGDGFSAGDPHYANGTYDGPMKQEVLVDPETAETYNLDVGDTLHVGGTVGGARRNEFEVVGISSTFRKFVGAPTATVRLSELQTLTGTAYDDRATMISVRLEDGADVAAVKADLEATYPELTVRTNREQFRAILERQTLLVAGGSSLAAVAILAGIVLSLNLFLSLMYQQRELFAVFRAVGGSRGSAVLVAVAQAAGIATLGCALGLALTPPLATAVEWLASTVSGFEGLVVVPTDGYLLGAGVAALFGVVGTLAGVLRLSRERLLAQLA